MLGNVHAWVHKLHGRMCIMNSWCTCKAPSDYSKCKRASKVLTKASLLLLECDGKCWCQMLYWLVVTRPCITHSIVECKNYGGPHVHYYYSIVTEPNKFLLWKDMLILLPSSPSYICLGDPESHFVVVMRTLPDHGVCIWRWKKIRRKFGLLLR